MREATTALLPLVRAPPALCEAAHDAVFHASRLANEVNEVRQHVGRVAETKVAGSEALRTV